MGCGNSKHVDDAAIESFDSKSTAGASSTSQPQHKQDPHQQALNQPPVVPPRPPPLSSPQVPPFVVTATTTGLSSPPHRPSPAPPHMPAFDETASIDSAVTTGRFQHCADSMTLYTTHNQQE